MRELLSKNCNISSQLMNKDTINLCTIVWDQSSISNNTKQQNPRSYTFVHTKWSNCMTVKNHDWWSWKKQIELSQLSAGSARLLDSYQSVSLKGTRANVNRQSSFKLTWQACLSPLNTVIVQNRHLYHFLHCLYWQRSYWFYSIKMGNFGACDEVSGNATGP